MTKQDVIYSTTMADGMFESVVTLSCLNGEAFQGNAGSTEKEAEHNAAFVALDVHAHDATNLPPKTQSQGRRAERSNTPRPLVLDANPKCGLIQFLQKFVGRTMTKADVQYSVVEVNGLHQATLVLHCLHSECYVSDPSPDSKTAEQSAARMALEMHSAEVRLLSAHTVGAPVVQVGGTSVWPAKPIKAGKEHRLMQGKGHPVKALTAVAPPACKRAAPASDIRSVDNNKTKLVKFLQCHVGRTLTKQDIAYICSAVDGHIVATVHVHCWDSQTFRGNGSTDEKSAEQNAAGAALQAFHREVAVWEAMPPKEKRPRPSQLRSLR